LISMNGAKPISDYQQVLVSLFVLLDFANTTQWNKK